MLKHRDHFHGSDLEKIEEIYGIKKEEITSFSANVNPLGISPLLKKNLSERIDAISTYPDREYTSLRKCIAAYCGTEYENIIVGNGSTELISLFIQVRHPKKTMILGPTYSEYERSVSLEGGTSLYYPLKESDQFMLQTEQFIESLNESIDLLIICNPNNPTSTAICQKDMRKILDACKQYDIFVMVDETYVEFADNYAQINAVPLTAYYNNIIILRGTSKFFAAPGLRLGYAVTGNRDLIDYINTHKNPWMINSLAAAAGEIMFQDDDYIQETKRLISSERTRMLQFLEQTPDFHPYPASANFILVRIKNSRLTSELLFDRAIREKMMIRDCSTFPFLDNSYIRFCVMSPEMNDKLLACLSRN
ncbi:Threonine-phosphate decarboxylase [uncultured Roseburia sp.]|uniref:Aminotransferase n=1 Tax=Brotonthovivens ammoniilytica TaxID=2981725 RepID=A0ABT2TH35_9FIRM|nr:histidinol-phosphate transaminase [Brotonthovivens ammoniilytica]MCU6761508.1 aminotransferase class I/II-fold pyridoxal phosphate-dependent enzyme [Brotonthovivens ammoniilytica]SCI30464.1 Threonine-phosphate decarboxylase [uncultured Roseburia sp.]